MKLIMPHAHGCSEREVAILATAIRDMELRGKSPMENLAVIQVEACLRSAFYHSGIC